MWLFAVQNVNKQQASKCTTHFTSHLYLVSFLRIEHCSLRCRCYFWYTCAISTHSIESDFQSIEPRVLNLTFALWLFLSLSLFVKEICLFVWFTQKCWHKQMDITRCRIKIYIIVTILTVVSLSLSQYKTSMLKTHACSKYTFSKLSSIHPSIHPFAFQFFHYFSFCQNIVFFSLLFSSHSSFSLSWFNVKSAKCHTGANARPHTLARIQMRLKYF